MNTNVLDKLSYGLYILSSKCRDKASGCIIDACIQAGTNPNRVLISVMNTNYTRTIIENSDVFSLGVLAENCPFEMIKHFGFQSSKNVDKFKDLTTFIDIHGVPCVMPYVCAVVSAKVVNRVNLGSHTVFIGEVKDQKLLTNDKPMTYSYYQNHIKPKDGRTIASTLASSESSSSSDNSINHQSASNMDTGERVIIGWRCTICGTIYNDPMLPDDYMCTVCGHPSSDFIPIYK